MSPPDTGASMLATPTSFALAAISCARDGSLVVMSTMMPPGFRPASTPVAGFRMTSRTSDGKPTIVNTISADEGQRKAVAAGAAGVWCGSRRLKQGVCSTDASAPEFSATSLGVAATFAPLAASASVLLQGGQAGVAAGASEPSRDRRVAPAPRVHAPRRAVVDRRGVPARDQVAAHGVAHDARADPACRERTACGGHCAATCGRDAKHGRPPSLRAGPHAPMRHAPGLTSNAILTAARSISAQQRCSHAKFARDADVTNTCGRGSLARPFAQVSRLECHKVRDALRPAASAAEVCAGARGVGWGGVVAGGASENVTGFVVASTVHQPAGCRRCRRCRQQAGP